MDPISSNLSKLTLSDNHFEKLSDEITFIVLSYLDMLSLCRVAQLSRKFQRLAGDDKLWETQWIISFDAQYFSPNLNNPDSKINWKKEYLRYYECDVKKNKDVKKAISLAYYYVSPYSYDLYHETKAINWMIFASQSNEYIDYDGFFRNFSSIKSIELFEVSNPMILAAATSPTIKEISLLYSDYLNSKIWPSKLSYFMCISSYLEHVDLSSTWYNKPLQDAMVPPIASALKTNKSIKVIEFVHSNIGDKSVTMILDAIDCNKDSAIYGINFAACKKLTECVALRLVEFVKNREQLWVMNLFETSLPEATIAEIKQILDKRVVDESKLIKSGSLR